MSMTRSMIRKPKSKLNARAPHYWLMKSEPGEFSIDDLERVGEAPWTGVRNYQARNFMRDDMRVGDLVLFYHSSTVPPGVAGIARVCREAHPDLTALDPGSVYHDPKATRENPVWFHVDVEFVAKFAHLVTLERIRTAPELADMLVLKRGMRLSIQPVQPEHFRLIERWGNA